MALTKSHKVCKDTTSHLSIPMVVIGVMDTTNRAVGKAFFEYKVEPFLLMRFQLTTQVGMQYQGSTMTTHALLFGCLDWTNGCCGRR